MNSSKTSKLFKTDKWFDAILISPRAGQGLVRLLSINISDTKLLELKKTEQKKNIFRFFRLPLQKEQDAEEAFGRLSKVLHELDIPVLYSVNILQEHCN